MIEKPSYFCFTRTSYNLIIIFISALHALFTENSNGCLCVDFVFLDELDNKYRTDSMLHRKI